MDKRRHILIIGDRPEVRGRFVGALCGLCRILEAENDEQALSILRKKRCAAAVVDADGKLRLARLLDEIRGEEACGLMPVIVLTDKGSEKELEAFRHGATLAEGTPETEEKLCELVESAVERTHTAIRAEKRRWQSEVAHTLEIDEKTGLWNRNTFCREVQRLIERNPERQYVLVRWDIDRFKVFNDTYGTAEGDKLLTMIGQWTRSWARSEQKTKAAAYGHWDADHFVCLVEGKQLSIEEEYLYIRRCLKTAYPRFDFAVRFGLYALNEGVTDVGVMCDRALLALRSIKNSYRQRYAWYDASMREHILEEQMISTEMKSALELCQFKPFYQPQYNYSSGELIGAEAVVRWIHPERGIIPPSKYIPVFEKNGFVFELDKYMWDTVCADMRRWLDMGLDVPPLSINVSRRDLFVPGIARIFDELMEKYGLSHTMLRLEITESAYMEEPAQLVKVVDSLRAEGFHVEMDDFGSGYSSLNTLKDVPVDTLKLDMKFVDTDAANTRGGSILSSVVHLAHNIDLPVIAEGVETKAQADYLKSIGCKYMQGYYFARPMPAEQFEALVRGSLTQDSSAPLLKVGIDKAVDFLNASTQSTLLFNSFVGGAAIIEYFAGKVTALRLNDKFFETVGVSPEVFHRSMGFKNMSSKSMRTFTAMLDNAISSDKEAECVISVERSTEEKSTCWLHCRVRCLAEKTDTYIFYLAIEDISERQRLMKYNAELNSRLTAVINSVPGGVQNFRVTGDSIICIYTNYVTAHCIGYTDNECRTLVGDDALGTVHPDDRRVIWHFLKSAQDGKISTAAFKMRMRQKNGAYRWMQVSGCVLERNGDELIISTIVIDIDSQMENERQNEMYGNIISNLPVGVAVYEIDDYAQPRYINDETCRLLGITRQEYDRRVRDGLPVFDRQIANELLKSCREELMRGKMQCFPRVLAHREDGSDLWLRVEARMVPSENDELLCYTTVIDVTNQVIAEDKINEKRRELAALIKNTPGGVVKFIGMGGAELRPVYVSDGFRELTGYDRDSFIALCSESVYDHIYPEDTAALKQLVTATLANKSTMSAQIRMLLKSGEYLWLDAHAIALEEGDETALYVSYTDISELRHAEEELRVRSEEYRIVTEHSGRHYYRYIIEGKIIECQQEDADYFGVPTWQENAPERVAQLGVFPPESIDSWLEIFDAIDSGVSEGGTELIINIGDEVRRFSLRYTGVKNSLGEQISAIVSYEDITEEHEKNKVTMFERDCMYKAVRMAYPMCISANLTKNSYYMIEYERYTNKTAAMQGSFDELIEVGLATVPDEDKERFQNAFARENILKAFARGEEKIELVHRQLGDDGVWHWVETTVLRVDDKLDDDIREITLSRIVDDQKRDEQKLKEALEITSGKLATRLRFGDIINKLSPGLLVVHFINGSSEPFFVGNLLGDLGFSEEEKAALSPQDVGRIIHKDDLPRARHDWRRISTENPESYRHEYRFCKKDGGIVWVTVYGTRFEDEEYGTGYISMYIDNTERRLLFDELQASRENFKLILENSERMITHYNITAQTALIQDKMSSLLGVPKELSNVPESVIRSGRIAEESVSDYRGMFEDIHAGIPCEQERRILRISESGQKIWFQSRYILVDGPNGAPVTAIIYNEDVTESILKEQMLISRAERDGLTGLYNRSAAESLIGDQLMNGETACALIIMDLDDLKEINDNLGHGQGDRALRYLSAAIKKHFKAPCIPGRLGGDEFLIFVPEVRSENELSVSITALQQEISGIAVGKNGKHKVMCSVGAVIGQSGFDDFETLYRRADTALYHVKHSGKNDYAFFNAAMQAADYIHRGRRKSISLKFGELQDYRELRRLVGAIATYYQFVMSVNLTKDSYCLLETGESIINRVPPTGTLSDFFSTGIQQFCKEDIAMIEQSFSRKALLRAYNEGKTSIRCHCREDVGEMSRQFEVVAVLFKTESGNIYSFFFARNCAEDNRISPKAGAESHDLRLT